ncbi:MAG: response regulator transcription factor, partial [Treponema sp.]|nr:response regulator transcription factor [Treponema sp.]
MITIVVGDRRRFSRRLLHTLSVPDDFSILGQARDGYELIRQVEQHKPDIVLLDCNLPYFNCFRAVSVLKSRSPETGVIILSGDDRHKLKPEEIFCRQIAGYISRDCKMDLLCNAIRTVYHGAWLISPRLAEQPNEVLTPACAISSSVSPTELEIMGRVSQGYSTREIAGQLRLSKGTVRNYISAILQKIGLKDRTQMAIFAIQHGIGAGPAAESL